MAGETPGVPIAPNTTSRPYRGLSVQDTHVPLTPAALQEYLVGREVYRRTEYLVLRNGESLALVRVRREADEKLFERVAAVTVMATPAQTLWIDSPETDVGNASALARVARANAAEGVKAYVVKGLYEHVNFIWCPAPLRIRVVEVAPPHPPKLLAMAEQAIAFDEELPPIELALDVMDIVAEAERNPSPAYLLPCRGSGVELPGRVEFLDTRPSERRDWLLIGCERSVEFHRHFYGDQPPTVDICPRRRVGAGGGITLTKCCRLERGIEVSGTTATVPWGASLQEVLSAVRRLAGISGNPGNPDGPPCATGQESG